MHVECGWVHGLAIFFILIWEYWMGKNSLKASSTIEFIAMAIGTAITSYMEKRKK